MESVRIGTILAHNKQAYQKWQRRRHTPKEQSLSGAALETAILNLAQMFPENVIRETVAR